MAATRSLGLPLKRPFIVASSSCVLLLLGAALRGAESPASAPANVPARFSERFPQGALASELMGLLGIKPLNADIMGPLAAAVSAYRVNPRGDDVQDAMKALAASLLAGPSDDALASKVAALSHFGSARGPYGEFTKKYGTQEDRRKLAYLMWDRAILVSKSDPQSGRLLARGALVLGAVDFFPNGSGTLVGIIQLRKDQQFLKQVAGLSDKQAASLESSLDDLQKLRAREDVELSIPAKKAVDHMFKATDADASATVVDQALKALDHWWTTGFLGLNAQYDFVRTVSTLRDHAAKSGDRNLLEKVDERIQDWQSALPESNFKRWLKESMTGTREPVSLFRHYKFVNGEYIEVDE